MIVIYATTTLTEFVFTWLTVRLLVRFRTEGRLNSRRHEIGLFGKEHVLYLDYSKNFSLFASNVHATGTTGRKLRHQPDAHRNGGSTSAVAGL